MSLKTAFQKFATNKVQNRVTFAKGQINNSIVKLNDAVKQFDGVNEQVVKKLNDYVQQLKDVKNSMDEIDKIDFQSISIQQRMKQQNCLDVIRKYEDVLSMLTIELTDMSNSAILSEEQVQALRRACTSPMGLPEWRDMITSISMALSNDFSTGLKAREDAFRKMLGTNSTLSGELAFNLTLPNMTYNVGGSPTTSYDVQSAVQNMMTPFNEINQRMKNRIEHLKNYDKKVKDTTTQQKVQFLEGLKNSFAQMFANNSNSNVRQNIADSLQLVDKMNKTITEMFKDSVFVSPDNLQEINNIIAKCGEDYTRLDKFAKQMDKNIFRGADKKIKLLKTFNGEIINTIGSLMNNYTKLFDGIIKQTSDVAYQIAVYQESQKNLQSDVATQSLVETTMGLNYFNANKNNMFGNKSLENAFLGLQGQKRISGENRFSAYSNEVLIKKLYHGMSLNNMFSKNLQEYGDIQKGDFNNIITMLSPIAENSAKQHIDILSHSKGTIFLTQKDKEIRKHIVDSAKHTVESIDKLMYVFSSLDKKPKAYDRLKLQRNFLQKEIEQIEGLEDTFTMLKNSLEQINKARKMVLKGLSGALSLMGIGSLLHPLQLLKTIFSNMTDMGKLRYKATMADYTMGGSLDVNFNDYMAYTLPQYYYDMTYGQIPRSKAVETYKGFAKHVGGHYGGGNPREDMAYLTAHTIVDQEMFGLDGGSIQQFMKIFYKDIGESAKEAVGRLRTLETFAHISNTPMEKLLELINGMSEGLRSAGMSSKKFYNALLGLTNWNGLRVEDAADMIQETTRATEGMARDWGRNLFWGIMHQDGKPFKGDIFEMLLDGMKSHDKNGKPIDKYYDTLVDRLFEESDFFGTRWGDDEGMNDVEFGSKLQEQGYSMKQVSVALQLKKEGKIDELKKKLKGWDELKDPLAPAQKTREYADQLHGLAEQLAETTKIQSMVNSRLYKMGMIFHKGLGPYLESAEKTFAQFMRAYSNAMNMLIRGVGGFLNSPIGNAITDSFEKHPFLTIAGGLVGAKVLKHGFKNIGKGLAGGKVPKPLAIAGIGATIGGYFIGSEVFGDALKVHDQMGDEGQATDSLQQLTKMFSDGTALIDIALDSKTTESKGEFAWQLAKGLMIAGAPYLAYKFATRFVSPKMKHKHQQQFRKMEKLAKSQIKGMDSFYKTFHDQQKKLRSLEKKLAKRQLDENHHTYKKYQKELRKWRRQARKILKHNEEVKKALRERTRLRAARRQRARQLARERAKFRAKTKGKLNLFKGFLPNLLFSAGMEFLQGGSDESVTDQAIDITTDATLMTAFGNKFGLKGSIAAMVLSPFAKYIIHGGKKAFASPMEFAQSFSNPTNQTGNPQTTPPQSAQEMVEWLNNSKERAYATSTAKNFDDISKNWQKDVEKMKENHESFSEEMKRSFDKHGLKWDDLSDQEKDMWCQNYYKFEALMGNYLQAISIATQVAASAKFVANGQSWSGGIASGAELLQKLKSFDPEAEKWIREAAQEFGVPAEDLAVIANIESGMNRNSNASGKGARGMMQLMPDTARGLGVNIDDPRDNIRGGAKEYSQLLTHYKGDKAKAFAAYNMGSPTLDGIIENHPNDWYNHMCAETSNYLVKAGLATGTQHNLTLTSGMNATPSSRNSSSPNTPRKQAPSSSGDMNGFDSRYLSRNGPESQTNLQNVQQPVKNTMNAIAAEYYAQTGEKLMITGGAEHGPHAKGQYGHEGGWKLDIATGIKDEALLGRLGDKYGVAIAKEDAYHYDLAFGPTGAGYNTNYITKTTKGQVAANGGANPVNINGMLNVKPYKPKTIKELHEDSLKAYYKAAGAEKNKDIKGAVIDNMYIDPNKKFVSIEDKIKQIKKERGISLKDDTSKEAIAAINAAKDELLNSKKETPKTEEDIELLESKKEAQARRIKLLVDKVKELVKKYFDEVEFKGD